MKRIIILAIISLISFSGIAQTKDSILTDIMGWTVQGEYKLGTFNSLKDIKLPGLTVKEINVNDTTYYALTDPTNTLPYYIRFSKSDYEQIFNFATCWNLQPIRVKVQLVNNETVISEGNFEIYKSGNVVRFNWNQNIREILVVKDNYFECNVEDWKRLNIL